MKTRNIYLIVWLMLIACTAQAQLTCEGCPDGTPDPLILAGGGTYQGDIVLIEDVVFTIAGAGNFELSGVISGAFGIGLNASDANEAPAKLTLGGKNTYTGATTVTKGALRYGIGATGKSSITIIEPEGVLSVGSSGNSGQFYFEELEFKNETSRFEIYASGAALSLVKLGADDRGYLRLMVDNGGTIDIMDSITLPAGEYPIIQGKIKQEAIPKFVIGKNNSGYCITVIQAATGIYLRLFKSGIITGPTAVCLEKTITLTAASENITKDTPGEWTLKSNAGSGLKILQSKIVEPTDNSGDLWKSEADLEAMSEGTVTALFTVSGCDKPAEYAVTVKPKPTITFNPPVHPGVGAGVDLEHNPGSTNIGIVPAIPGTMVTWRVSRNKYDDSGPDRSQVRISKDGSTLEDIPIEGGGDIKLTSATPEAGPLLYKLVSNKDGISALTFVVFPQYASEGVTCYGPSNSIKVTVLGYEVPADIGSLKETSAKTESANAGNINPKATLCDGRETNIRVGKEGDGNLYRWYSDKDNGVKGNSVRASSDVAATIKDRLTLSKKHSTSIAYYITPSSGNCDGATVRVPILINPTPSITTKLDKAAICNNTATPSIELATDIIEEEEADKVTYTWTVSENNVGAISESTPVKKILPQTLTHTSSADESVIYSFIPAYTDAGVACAGEAVTLEVLVRGAIAAGFITGIETSAVCLGDEVSTLSIASDGSGALKYQWMKDNVAIADANTASYTIPTAEISSGNYAVSVSNDCEIKIADSKVLNVTADAYFEKAIAAADQTESASQGLIKFTYTGPSALYSWDFNDQAAISPLQNPAHKYTKAGTWTPTLTVVKSAAQTQCAKKFILSPLVIKEIADKTAVDIATKGINVYPIPAKDQVTISSQYELTGIAIRDMSGKNVIHTETVGYEQSISVSTLPVGLYILEIIDSDGVKRIKMIKE